MDCMHNRYTVSAIVSALALLCSTPYPAAAQEPPAPVAAAPSTPEVSPPQAAPANPPPSAPETTPAATPASTPAPAGEPPAESPAAGPLPEAQPGAPPPLPAVAPRRLATRSSHQAWVAAANPLAVEAGLEILGKGGKALDAAVAVQAMLGLVEPQSSGVG